MHNVSSADHHRRRPARIAGEESHRHVDSPMSESVGKKRRAGRKGAPREGNEPATLNGHETEIPRRGGSFAGLKEWPTF